MMFGQPLVPTNDQILNYIDHINKQMEIACEVLMAWQYDINDKKLLGINKQTKGIFFHPF